MTYREKYVERLEADLLSRRLKGEAADRAERTIANLHAQNYEALKKAQSG